MAVSLRMYLFADLYVAPDGYEHSDRSKFATEQVLMYCENDSVITQDAARGAARRGPEALAEFVIGKFQYAPKGSYANGVACELAIADFRNGRIRWAWLAAALLSDE